MKSRDRSRRANRWPWVIIALVGVVVLALAATLRSPAPSPRLVVEQPLLDLGQVPAGQTVTAIFRLTNEGAAPLQFEGPPEVEVVEGC